MVVWYEVKWSYWVSVFELIFIHINSEIWFLCYHPEKSWPCSFQHIKPFFFSFLILFLFLFLSRNWKNIERLKREREKREECEMERTSLFGEYEDFLHEGSMLSNFPSHTLFSFPFLSFICFLYYFNLTISIFNT